MDKKTYVISDIHGCYNQFIEMLKLINFSKSDELYIIGDIWDRGAYPLEILDYILKHENIIHLKGNHELLFQEAYESNHFSSWYANGGKSTYLHMLEKGEDYIDNLYKYVKKLPKIKVIDKFILAHAGLYFPDDYNDLTLPELLNCQDEETLLWTRENINNEKQYKDYTVICGHTPVQCITNDNDNIQIIRKPGTIYIDCGCVFKDEANGKLACLRLNDDKEFYV